MFEKILLSLWSVFGIVIEVCYDYLFKYCIITYDCSPSAINAIDRLNEKIEVAQLVDEIIASFKEEDDQALARRCFNELFVCKKGIFLEAVSCATAAPTLIVSDDS